LEDSSEIGVLELVGMAIAVNVARLLEYKHTLEEAKKDKLSGLYYKHIFHQDLNRLWEEAKKKKIYCAVIMEDFDFFKMINDTYGHPEGDKVIAGIGEYFKKKSKHSYRIGGDEFTQLLTFDGKVPVEQAEQKIVLFLKELRAELPQLYVPKGCRKLSASIGALLTRGGKYSNLGDIRTIHHKETGEARYDADSEGLYNRVDAAVYEAKDKGRDIIVFYGLKSKYLINGALAEK
jgi:diguanylate cyclase (GGDEF)-like protein